MKRIFVLTLVGIWMVIIGWPSRFLCSILDWSFIGALHLNAWALNVACMALVEGGLATIVEEDEPHDKA